MYIEITPREWSTDAQRKERQQRKEAHRQAEAENLAAFLKTAQKLEAQKTVQTRIVSQKHKNGATVSYNTQG